MRKLIKVTWQENAALIRRSEGRALILTIPGGKVDLYQAPWAEGIIAEMRGELCPDFMMAAPEGM